jgi:hyperosmotically inducible protein
MKTTNKYRQNILADRVIVIACLSAVLGLAGCQQEGPAEKTGKKIDSAAEKAEQKIDQTTEQAKKGNGLNM